MVQQLLLDPMVLGTKTIQIDNVKAVFTTIRENVYEVVLEISSHKFVISLENILEKIEKFEVLAVKWFMEITMKSIQTLKNLIEYLWYRID